MGLRELKRFLRKMDNLMNIQINESDPQKKATKVIEEFDNHYKTLVEVATVKSQAEHDANMFRKVCQNVKNYLAYLDTCIKELRRCLHEGK